MKLLSAFLFLFTFYSFSQDLPETGKKAPDFTLPFATKDTIIMQGISLKEFIGKKNVILAFYPADWSGGCTKELCTMRDNFEKLSSLNAEILAISGDYVFSHKEWAKYLNLPFKLLSDHDHSIAKIYHSYNEKNGYNKRTVFLVDKEGKIAYTDMNYKVSDEKSFSALQSALNELK